MKIIEIKDRCSCIPSSESMLQGNLLGWVDGGLLVFNKDYMNMTKEGMNECLSEYFGRLGVEKFSSFRFMEYRENANGISDVVHSILKMSYEDCLKDKNKVRLAIYTSGITVYFTGLVKSECRQVVGEYINDSGEVIREVLLDGRKDPKRTVDALIKKIQNKDLLKKLEQGYKGIVKPVKLYVNTYSLDFDFSKGYDNCTSYYLKKTEMFSKDSDVITGEGAFLVHCESNDFKDIPKLRIEEGEVVFLGAEWVDRSSDWSIATVFGGSKPWIALDICSKDKVIREKGNFYYSHHSSCSIRVFKFIEEGSSWCYEYEGVYLKADKDSNIVTFDKKEEALAFGTDSNRLKDKVRDRIAYGSKEIYHTNVLKVDNYENLPEGIFKNGEAGKQVFVEECKRFGLPKNITIYNRKVDSNPLGAKGLERFFAFYENTYIVYATYKTVIVRDYMGDPMYYSLTQEGTISKFFYGRNTLGLMLNKDSVIKALDSLGDYMSCPSAQEYEYIRKIEFNVNRKCIVRKLVDEEMKLTIYLSRLKGMIKSSSGELEQSWEDFHVLLDKRTMNKIGGDILTKERMECLKYALQTKFIQRRINKRGRHKYIISIWDESLQSQRDPLLSFEENSAELLQEAITKISEKAQKGEVIVVDRVNEDTGSINMFTVYSKSGEVLKKSTDCSERQKVES